MVLPVVLYECETWSLILREDHRLRVFENRVLRRIFGPKRDEVTGPWRKLRIEKLNYLYSSPNIVRVIKSRRMKWVGHLARMGERRSACRIWWGNLSERDHLQDAGIYGKIILKWIFKKWDVKACSGSIWPRIGTRGGRLCML